MCTVKVPTKVASQEELTDAFKLAERDASFMQVIEELQAAGVSQHLVHMMLIDYRSKVRTQVLAIQVWLVYWSGVGYIVVSTTNQPETQPSTVLLVRPMTIQGVMLQACVRTCA